MRWAETIGARIKGTAGSAELPGSIGPFLFVYRFIFFPPNTSLEENLMAEPWRGPCGPPPSQEKPAASLRRPRPAGLLREGGGATSPDLHKEVKTSPKPPPSAQNDRREDEEERKAPPATGTGLAQAAITPHTHPKSEAPRWPTRPGPPSLPTGAPPEASDATP